MAIKCVVFDADGVIITSEMFSLQYQKKYPITNEEMLPFFKGAFQECLVGKADLKEVIGPHLPSWRWEKSTDELLEFWFSAQHAIDQRVINQIVALRKNGIPCYLATNQEKYRTNYMIHKMGFGELFDSVFSSAFIGHKKPEQGFYEHILSHVASKGGILPEEIMFFDDDLPNVKQAKEMGVDAHHYTNYDEFAKLIAPLLNTS